MIRMIKFEMTLETIGMDRKTNGNSYDKNIIGSKNSMVCRYYVPSEHYRAVWGSCSGLELKEGLLVVGAK